MIRFRLILGHILDWYGYVLCEATFIVGDWYDKHYKYDDDKERYEGFMGILFELMWKTSNPIYNMFSTLIQIIYP